MMGFAKFLLLFALGVSGTKQRDGERICVEGEREKGLSLGVGGEK